MFRGPNNISFSRIGKFSAPPLIDFSLPIKIRADKMEHPSKVMQNRFCDQFEFLACLTLSQHLAFITRRQVLNLNVQSNVSRTNKVSSCCYQKKFNLCMSTKIQILVRVIESAFLVLSKRRKKIRSTDEKVKSCNYKEAMKQLKEANVVLPVELDKSSAGDIYKEKKLLFYLLFLRLIIF